MFSALNAELICHPHLKGLCSGCMTLSKAMFVRISNSEGKYLGGEATKMDFFDDINKAIIFDSRRDHIDPLLELIRQIQGIVLEIVPVDPKEIHETCDRCGRLVLAFQVFFDGNQYLCTTCRNAADTA